MPWYLRCIARSCHAQSCERPATHELMDNHNSNWGCFCEKHGAERLAAERAKSEPVAPRKKR